MKMKEYAFDCTMAAVVRVRAESEADARDAMDAVLDAASISRTFINGFNSKAERVEITEASIEADESGPSLFEIDGDPNAEGVEA